MSIKDTFPDIKPTLLLDFANTKTLDPRIVFTRASTATYYDGKTVAKAEENLLKFSQDFDNAAWAKALSTVTANATAAPDGTTTADLIAETATTGFHELFQLSLQFVNGSSYVFSIYAKASTSTVFQMFMPSAIRSSCFANFDLSGGVVGTAGVGANATIASVGNGWYRCSLAFTAAASISSIAYTCLVNNNAASAIDPSYAGTAGNGVYLWGAQLEQRASVTAYTPTYASPITNYVPALQTAPAGVPRFDHNPVTGESLGLFIEGPRTNLLVYSEDFANAQWGKNGVVVTSDVAVSPAGTLTMDMVGSGNFGNDFLSASVGVSVGTVVTFSFYVKNNNANSSRLMGRTSITSMEMVINWSGKSITSISAGTAGGQLPTDYGFFPVGGDIYRVYATYTVGETNQSIRIYPSNANNGSSIFAWGAQIEAGAFATSYIPTAASAVTRAADTASISGGNFASWFRKDEGTILYATGPAKYIADSRVMWQLDDAVSGYLQIMYASYSVGGNYYPPTTIPAGQKNLGPNINAFSFSPMSSAVCANGASVTNTSSRYAFGSAARFTFGAAYFPVRKMAFYPKLLTNAQLQALTS